ncbi:glycine zipper 2TM domain-containing protein [Alloalcanivorax sp. C16-2]|uniref:glycine zipper 2TM domain-containing protein n=1 Tax=Alloalcanivorax TaxID=3020832 RepID=UPI001932F450|nr:glycine zipper 2TM domain-containing protein [Alloalcanivorax marinus]MBL7249532.1 glycine zipper 2TM domain-containing protein [Alloalcanivorax marinus]
MNTPATVALAVVGTLAVVGVGYGGYQAISGDADRYAEVVKVEPATKSYQEPEQRCQQVTVQRQKPVKDEHQVAGSVIGAVVGGVIGHQFGGGSGKDAATAAGAIAGGYAGNKTQERMQQGNTYTTTEERCETVMNTRTEKNGYNVTYRLDGQTHTVRMDDEPGDRLPVENGQVITD